MVARSRSVGQSGQGLGRTVAVGRPVGPRSWSHGRGRSVSRATALVARSRSVCQSGHGLGRTAEVGRPVGPQPWPRGRSRSACRTTVWVARSQSVGQSGRRSQGLMGRKPATGRGPTCSKRGGGHEPAGTGRSLKWNDDRRKQFRKLVRFGGERCFKIFVLISPLKFVCLALLRTLLSIALVIS